MRLAAAPADACHRQPRPRRRPAASAKTLITQTGRALIASDRYGPGASIKSDATGYEPTHTGNSA